MIRTSDAIVVSAICAAVGFLAGNAAGSAWTRQSIDKYYGLTSLVEECEAELPRNKSCEIVVTAKVKVKEKDE